MNTRNIIEFLEKTCVALQGKRDICVAKIGKYEDLKGKEKSGLWHELQYQKEYAQGQLHEAQHILEKVWEIIERGSL